ncbi:MAG: hypothetical protein QW511_04510, partial [Candidatus Methanomethylicia archaeon]
LMSESIVGEVIDAVERTPDVRRRLASALVIDSDVRLAIINAVVRDVATKSDIEALRSEIGNVNRRIDSLIKWIIGLMAAMWTSIMGTLLVLIFR